MTVFTLSPRPRGSSPLASAPVRLPPDQESEWSDDSDCEADSSPSTRRRVRGRHMHIVDPRSAGLYTLCEEDDEEDMPPRSNTATTHKQRPRCIVLPRSANIFASPGVIIHTPGSDSEDPFALDDMPSFHEEPKPVSKSSPPRLPPKKVAAPKSQRNRRPPPLELAAPDCPLSSLRYPVSPHRLDFALNRPSSPTVPPRPPRSPIRPARVASASALPRTPTVRSAGQFPTAPTFLSEGWEETTRGSMSPEPQTPITPTTPTLEFDVNLESALRELLTSCGEYEDFDDMFPSEDVKSPVVPRSSSLSAPTPPARSPEDLFFMPASPSRSNSMPVPKSPSSSTAAVCAPPGRAPRHRPSASTSTSRSILPRPSDRPVGLFGHHAYLRSLSIETDGSVCPLATPTPTHTPTSPMLDKPLPLLEVCEPSDMETDDEDDAASIRSLSSLPGLSYNSSATSISSAVTSSSFVYSGETSPLYSLANKTSTDVREIKDVSAKYTPADVPPVPPMPYLGRHLKKFWT